MSEVGDLVKLLEGPLGLIGTTVAAAGAIAYSFAAAELKNAAGRQRLRTALEAGGHLRRFYVQLLAPALDRLDSFLGDADKAASSLPSPFGNREQRPYWTAWSFDRCALLALVYPLLSLFVVWVCTGESGPIAERLGMQHGAVWWSRLLSTAATVLFCVASWHGMRSSGWRSLVWVAVAVAGAGAVEYCERHKLLGRFWAAYWPIILAVCYIGLIGAARFKVGPTALSIILMFGLIPIVNIPLDWASLGLTRALLRRGVEAGAPSPLWLGLIDFGFGLILLALLALALIASLQAADAVIIHFGGKAVANVVELLDNIDANPRDPANYWAYFTLFSTLIPSALNAVIGAVSLIGWWLPPARGWVLTQLLALDRYGDDEGYRWRISAALAGQVGAGTALTCLVLWSLWELLLEFPLVFPFVIGLLKQFALALA